MSCTQFSSIARALILHGVYRASNICAVMDDTKTTYGELLSRSVFLYEKLLKDKTQPGDRIGFLGGNGVEFLVTMLATWLARGVFVPFSTMLSGEALALLLQDAKPKITFYEEQYSHLMNTAQHAGFHSYDCSILPINIVFELANEIKITNISDLSLDQMSDACTLLYSSGTTGVPKGILHDAYARQQFALGLASELGIDRYSKILVTTPMYSNGTMIMLLPALMMGACIYIRQAFKPEHFIKDCDFLDITHTFVVPLQCSLIIRSTDFSPSKFSKLRTLLCGGAPMPLDIKRQMISSIKERFTELYGLTEGFATLTRPALEIDPEGCGVGRPMSGNHIMIIDGDKSLCRNQIGEIVGMCGGLMTGYYLNEQLTLEARWLHPNGEIYIRSGDIGYLDFDGNLHIVDRKKDMIISGGFNVYPSDIETVLLRNELIAEVAVVGVSDEKWGETPVAFFIPSGKSVVDTEELMVWANARLSKVQRLRDLIAIPQFPRNALGKVLKQDLRKLWKAGYIE
jgi:long-chain acyl-CoA synthetase